MTNPYLITICSGKGGVGKSFIAANLAFILAAHNQKTLLIDGDLQFPNIHLMLGVDVPFHLDDYLKGRSINEVIYRYSEHLSILSGAVNNSAALFNKFDFIKLYNNLRNCFDFDFIIVDNSAGISNHLLESVNIVDRIFLVLTDEPTSIIDGYSLLKILLNYKDAERINLLLNNIIDDSDVNEIMTKINIMTNQFLNISIDLFEAVFYDVNVRRSIITQELLTISQLDSPAVRQIQSVAEKLIAIKNKIKK